jgi:hypothetical protein
MILEYLRRLREDMSVMKEDIRVINDRLGHLERNQGELAVQYAALSTRIDGIDGRLERIERRLELRQRGEISDRFSSHCWAPTPNLSPPRQRTLAFARVARGGGESRGLASSSPPPRAGVIAPAMAFGVAGRGQGWGAM